MKTLYTYGFLVAISSEDELNPNHLTDEVVAAIKHEFNVLGIITENIDCETLGEIDVYPEIEKEKNGSTTN